MNAQSKLISFYSGADTDIEGRTINEILTWDDAKLEYVHNYIQWLFPLCEPSVNNADAPILTDEDIKEFTVNTALRHKVLESFERLLKFYGLKQNSDRIVIATSFPDRAKIWITPKNHNFLRITHILKCLKTLGFGKEAGMFLTCLENIYRSYRSIIGGGTYRYWLTAT